jgi:TPR repeat protein
MLTRDEIWPALPRSAWALTGALLLGACTRPTMPDPKDAVRAYQAAAERGDAQAIYGMLSKRSQSSVRATEVARIVADERSELAAQAKGLGEPGSVVRASARVRYPDGEDATLSLEDGNFRVSTAFGLPSAHTTREALEELRRALARRSYAALMRVLSPSTRSAIESDLRSLVDGLAHPEGLEVQEAGDAASVQIPGGHFVKLRREGGVWRIEDFD